MHSIAPSALPAITRPLTIDGTSEINFLASSHTYPLVSLSGASSIFNGLDVQSAGFTLRGLNFRDFTNAGAYLESSAPGAVVQGNYFGTDVTGTKAAPNGSIIAAGANDQIGGATVPANGITALSAGNLVSGNTNVRGSSTKALCCLG